jgi:hypothetical protein
MTEYRVKLIDDFDEVEWDIEQKGWHDVTVDITGVGEVIVAFYDPARLSQEIQSALERSEIFFERRLVVVPTVNRAHIEAALARIWRRL